MTSMIQLLIGGTNQTTR